MKRSTYGTGWNAWRKDRRAKHLADGCTRFERLAEELEEQKDIVHGFRVSNLLKYHLSIDSNTLKLADLTHAHALYCLQQLGQIEPVFLFSVHVKNIGGEDFTVQMDSANNSLSVLKDRIIEGCGDLHSHQKDLIEIHKVKNAEDGDRWEITERIADDSVIAGNCNVSVIFVRPIWEMLGGNEMNVSKNSCINGDITIGDFTEGLVSVASF
jgi:hypothetical protein